MDDQRAFEHETYQARRKVARGKCKDLRGFLKRWAGVLFCVGWVAACMSVLMIVGCASDVASNLVKLPTGEIVSAATDRFGVHERIEVAKTKVAGKVLDAKIAEANARKAEAENRSNVVITINDKDSMALYQLGEANRQLAEANRTMGQIAKALATGENEYAGLIEYEPMPLGAFAEGFREFFGGVAHVSNSTGAEFLTGGLAAKWVFGEVAQATKGNEFHGDVHATNSFNFSEQHQTGSAGAVATLAPSTVKPEVVDLGPEPEVTE